MFMFLSKSYEIVFTNIVEQISLGKTRQAYRDLKGDLRAKTYKVSVTGD